MSKVLNQTRTLMQYSFSRIIENFKRYKNLRIIHLELNGCYGII